MVARRAGVPGAEALPLAALALAQPRQSERRLALARGISTQFGVPLPARVMAAAAPSPAPAPASPSLEPVPPVRLRCLGGFRLEIGGRLIDLRDTRPRARAALRLLALHAALSHQTRATAIARFCASFFARTARRSLRMRPY